MENIGAGVSDVLTHKKKEVGEQEIEEREYIQKKIHGCSGGRANVLG